VNGGERAPVQQVRGYGECLSPVRCRHVRMDEHGVAYVVQCAKNALGLAILWGSVWTREA